MFLFPQLYYGQRISDFEKIDIFGVTADFGPVYKALRLDFVDFLHERP